MLMMMKMAEREAVARVEGVYIRALPMPPLKWHLPFDPRALDEPNPLSKHPLRAKEVVGTNRDEIHVESRQERQLLVLPGLHTSVHTTSHGRMERLLSY
jgi:hypothetical protein